MIQRIDRKVTGYDWLTSSRGPILWTWSANEPMVCVDVLQLGSPDIMPPLFSKQEYVLYALVVRQ